MWKLDSMKQDKDQLEIVKMGILRRVFKENLDPSEVKFEALRCMC